MFAGRFVSTVEIERGVRQGDIISPLLFNLCLSTLLEKLDQELSGVILGTRCRITHTAYADDLMIVIRSDLDRRKFRVILADWETVSGMRINAKKTMEMRIKDTNVQEPWPLVNEVLYLGITFDTFGEVVWKPILDRLFTRLDACKLVCDKQTTLRERVCTVNTYALSMLNYVLKVDCSMEDHEATIRRKIVASLGKRGHVTWRRLVASYEEGGFGLVDLDDLNSRLKLSWRTYLWRNSDLKGCFVDEIERWSSVARRWARTFVGPLLAKNPLDDYVDQWSDIAKELHGVLIRSSDVIY
jgi:hypothetical protein